MFNGARFGKPTSIWKLGGLLILLLAIGLVAVPPVGAFESRSGGRVVIESDEVIDDDLYVFAAALDLQGTVNGDVVFFGQRGTIEGTVRGDLIVAGQHVVISGEVGDDVRVGAYAIEVSGAVGDDLVGAGFSMQIGEEAAVGGDLIFAGYQTSLTGRVVGEAEIAGNAVDIQGTIGGDATVDVGGAKADGRMPPGFPFFPGAPPVPSVPSGLTIGSEASIGGELNYTANRELDIPEDAVDGEIDFTRHVPDRGRGERAEPSVIFIFFRGFARQLRRLITLLLIGALMLWLVPDWTRKIEETVRSEPLLSLGWGVVVLAAFIVGMVALALATGLLAVIFGVITLGELAGRIVALGSILLGTAGFGFSIIWAYITRIIISLLLGHLVFRLFKSPAAEKLWWPGVVGVLIFVLITAIPLVGWLVGLVAAVAGLGALWLWGRKQVRTRRPQAPPEMPGLQT
jgi:hypothetical protein